MARKRKTYQRGVVEQKGSYWTLRFRELDHRTGKWSMKRERLGVFKNKTAARRAAEPRMAKINDWNNADRPPEVQQITFRTFVEGRWKAYILSAKLQPTTLSHYDSVARIHLLPFFGEMLLKDIKPMNVSELMDGLQERAGNTLRLIYKVMKMIFDLAIEFDLIEVNPVRKKLHCPEVEKVEKPILKPDEIRAVLEHLNETERLFVILLSVTGIRMGEGQALRWMDFNESRCELAVNHTLYKKKPKCPKTAKSIRKLRLHPGIVARLASHKAQSPFTQPTDFIFCRVNGEPLNQDTIRKRLNKAMDDAKIKRGRYTHGFHIFRHTAGSMIYEKSRGLKLVQGVLGHSAIGVTSDVYVHLDETTIAEGTALLTEELFGGFPSICDPTVTLIN
ncbi:MAG: integrase [Blastocatellia bacterium]